MRLRTIPKTSNLNLNLVMLSVLNIIKRAEVHTVKLMKSSLLNMTIKVNNVYSQRIYQVSVNHGTSSYPNYSAILADTASIFTSAAFSLTSSASSLAYSSGVISQFMRSCFFCSSKSSCLYSTSTLNFFSMWKP